MDDLQRVIQAAGLCKTPKGPWRCQEPCGPCKSKTAAAMRATREIDAEALRTELFADSDGVYSPDTHEIANWLLNRSKSNG